MESPMEILHMNVPYDLDQYFGKPVLAKLELRRGGIREASPAWVAGGKGRSPEAWRPKATDQNLGFEGGPKRLIYN